MVSKEGGARGRRLCSPECIRHQSPRRGKSRPIAAKEGTRIPECLFVGAIGVEDAAPFSSAAADVPNLDLLIPRPRGGGKRKYSRFCGLIDA